MTFTFAITRSAGTSHPGGQPGARVQRGLIAAMLGVFAAVMLPGNAFGLGAGLVSNVLLIAMPLAAAACCLLRALSEQPGRRRSWGLMGAAVLSWGLGQGVWTTYEQLLGRDVPFPSLADVGYLSAIPLLLIGLLLLPYAELSLATRLRILLDGMVIGVAILLVAWPLVLQPTLEAAQSGWIVDSITLAYPVGDSVAIILALVAVSRARHGIEVRLLTLLMLAAGTVAFAVGDTGFLLLTQAGTYSSGHPVDLGWATGFALIAFAATMGGSSTTANPSESSVNARRLALLAPYVAAVIAVGVAGATLWQTGRLGSFVIWLLLVELMLLVARQVLTMFENDSLTSHLERRVADRTEQLASRERWFGSLVHNSFDVILVLTPSGVIDFQTPSAERVLGYAHDELAGIPLTGIMAGEDATRVASVLQDLPARSSAMTTMNLAVRHHDGAPRDTETTITSLVHDPAVRGFVVTIRDVTDRRRLEQELTQRAFHDELTGLANKALFCDRVERALAAASRTSASIAVLFIDLDDFKSVNDSLGHACGDELLKQVAERLQGCVRPDDTVARFGGDEFAVLIESMTSGDEAIDVARRFRAALQATFPVGGREVLARASMGVAITRSGGEAVDELLRNADLAMYRAKAQGDGRYQLYEDAMHTSVLTRLELEEDLRNALPRGEFHLNYQPTIELSTQRITGVEALLRWVHPVRGDVPPLNFITLAEDIGLIGEIGAWVIDEASRQSAVWQAIQSEPFTVAVNISGRQLQPELITQIRGSLGRHGVPASTLTLEMTESVLISHSHDVLDLLGELREMGVSIAIDDFGTGYSSLSYLSRLPVDILKLDRSFVEKVATQAQEAELTRMIVALARTLGLTTVAEGIEHGDQLTQLAGMGCTHGQGYLFSPPITGDALTAMLLAQPRATARAGGLVPGGRRPPVAPAPRTGPRGRAQGARTPALGASGNLP